MPLLDGAYKPRPLGFFSADSKNVLEDVPPKQQYYQEHLRDKIGKSQIFWQMPIQG